MNTTTATTIIRNNLNLFTPGNTLSLDQMASWTSTPLTGHTHKDTLTLVDTYTSLNRVLRKMGLAIKSQNYYSSFTVLDNNQYESRVKSYAKQARRLAKAADTLAVGYNTRTLSSVKKVSASIKRV